MIDTKLPFPVRPYQLTETEIEFIEYCRNFKYGKMTLYIENTQPKWAENPLPSVKFGTKKPN